jgi:2-hydroxy-3-keto-5-methylthiopentenyl-1-phosphate phosphatase
MNSWLRKKPNGVEGSTDIAKSLDTQRRAMSTSMTNENEETLKRLRHKIEIANSISDFEAAVQECGYDVYQVIADPDMLDRLVDDDNIDSVRTLLSSAVDRLSNVSLNLMKNDGHNSDSIVHKPMVQVKLGSPSLKRSMGF